MKITTIPLAAGIACALLGVIDATFSSARAQAPKPPLPPLAVTGAMDIRFTTRTPGAPDDAVDTYTVKVLNLFDAVKLHGTVQHLPYLANLVTRNRPGNLTYTIECDLVNPRTHEDLNVGRLYGVVPIDEHNTYRFGDGGLKIAVLSLGQAKGFESHFQGNAVGKPLPGSAWAKAAAKVKKDVLQFTGNKGARVEVSNYDVMQFQNHVLAAGPAGSYPETAIGGDAVYDYDRDMWWFKSLTATYAVGGARLQDSITGTIRWIKAPTYATSGESHYDFDVRVNEPAATEDAAFAVAKNDEAAFFATDDSVPTLTGSITYKDTFSGGRVVASAITIDLRASKLTRQQVMYLCKLILLSMIVPFNAE